MPKKKGMLWLDFDEGNVDSEGKFSYEESMCEYPPF